MIRLMVVDDDPFVVTGIASLLQEDTGLQIVATANNGQQAVERLRDQECDVILMDLRMPVLNGIEATRAIRSLPSSPRILVLTTWDTDDMIRDAFAAGADGFLLKDASPAELGEAIRSVHGGRTTLAPAVTDRLVRAFTRQDPEAVAAREAMGRLTAMEHAVAHAIADGMTNADIAATQFMSVGNVKACVSRILAKLELSNRVEIATLVHRSR